MSKKNCILLGFLGMPIFLLITHVEPKGISYVTIYIIGLMGMWRDPISQWISAAVISLIPGTVRRSKPSVLMKICSFFRKPNIVVQCTYFNFNSWTFIHFISPSSYQKLKLFINSCIWFSSARSYTYSCSMLSNLYAAYALKKH